MESRKRTKSFKGRRLKQQLDELAERIKALPPDRIQALQEDVLMVTASKVRQARHADRQRELGRMRPNWWIDVDTVNEIRRRAAARGGKTQDAVNAVLKELLSR